MDPTATLLIVGTVAGVVILILIARRSISSPGRKIDRYIAQIEAGETPDIPERTDWDHEVSLQSKGFSIRALSESSESAIDVDWDSVVEATAFKRDLFSTDRVCIVFRLVDDSEVEAHEEMKGWTELCEVLPASLLGAPAWTEWFMEITTPAFELNPTPLFRRAEAVRTP